MIGVDAFDAARSGYDMYSGYQRVRCGDKYGWVQIGTGAIGFAGSASRLTLEVSHSVRQLGRIRSASSTFQYGDKISRQMGPRGWTDSLVDEAVSSGQQVSAMNKATGNAAIRYVHPRTGQSVVIDDVTNEVIHVGGPGFKYGPVSGDVP